MSSDTFTIRDAIALLVERRDLNEAQAAACMEELMTGAATPAQFGAYVTALRMKGETADEITGMARVMREKSLHVETDGPLLDTCGTGGDGSGSFNVSTCAAFVAAGAGARVAKHGNRAMTSALGAKIDLPPARVAACIQRSGVGFMFAQGFHPAMKFVAPLRREIGVRTVFNILGPLTNPAGATRQVVGVPRPELVPVLAAALRRLGSEHALVVHGEDCVDEVSVSAATIVADVSPEGIRSYQLSPEDFGLSRHDISHLRGGTPEQNATELKLVLDGAEGPLRDFTIINSGAALIAWGAAATAQEAAGLAAKSIDSGAAAERLAAFIEATNAS